MKTKEWEYASISKCSRGFMVRPGETGSGTYSLTGVYCFNTYAEAVAFIAEQMGE